MMQQILLSNCPLFQQVVLNILADGLCVLKWLELCVAVDLNKAVGMLSCFNVLQVFIAF